MLLFIFNYRSIVSGSKIDKYMYYEVRYIGMLLIFICGRSLVIITLYGQYSNNQQN